MLNTFVKRTSGVVFGVLLLAGYALAANNPWEVRLPFKSATIKYELSGMEKGNETLYIEKYGELQAKYLKSITKVMFSSTEKDEIHITTPEWVYNFDMNERTGTKMHNPNLFFLEEYNKLSSKEKKTVLKNSEEMGKTMVEGMQGVIEKNAATILGQKCDKVTAMGSTIYSIHDTGIPLKTETSMIGMSFKSVATSLKKGRVPSSVFAFPKGIEPTYDKEAEKAMRQMAKKMIANLKDPDFAKRMKENSEQRRVESRKTEDSPRSGRNEQEQEDALEKSMEMFKGLFGE